MKFSVRCPTRIDLAGGTLDLWPIYSFLGECFTINAAIDIFTQVDFEFSSNKMINIEITNLNFKKSFPNLESLLKSKNKALQFIKPHLEYWSPDFGFSLKTNSMSPIGGGLGGSSSLTVAIIKTFSIAMKRELSRDQIVTLAHNIEAQILNTPTGTQDYIPPLEGGINLLKYNMLGLHVEKLSLDLDKVNKRLLLIYTGVPHHSGLNNWQVLKKTVEGDPEVRTNLTRLNTVSKDLYKKILEGDWDFESSFKSEYKWRSRLSKHFTSPEIRRLEKLAFKNKALSIKICGAGGGGCVFLWCKEGDKERLSQICQNEGYKVLKANLINYGAQVIEKGA